MEVHHHAHDPAAPHHKKNWKSYFWEFLMLFLAVYCGFLAENFREHKVEAHRGEQYVSSFILDLKTDTANAAALIKEYENKLPQIDSLLSHYPELMNGDALAVAQNSAVLGGYTDFYHSDGTMQQLKNSGNLRLLKKTAVDSIMAYDLTMKDVLLEQEHIGLDNWKKIWEIQLKIFDRYKVDSLQKANYRIAPGGEKIALLLTRDRAHLVEYYSYITALRSNIVYFIAQLKELKQKGENLILFLNKEYDFQD